MGEEHDEGRSLGKDRPKDEDCHEGDLHHERCEALNYPREIEEFARPDVLT
jgi:hypothetical protein